MSNTNRRRIEIEFKKNVSESIGEKFESMLRAVIFSVATDACNEIARTTESNLCASCDVE